LGNRTKAALFILHASGWTIARTLDHDYNGHDRLLPRLGAAVIRITHGPQRYWIDFSGTRLMELCKFE